MNREAKPISRNDEPREGRRPLGVAARFAGPAELLAAAQRIREAGFRRWDCHSPFPVHGLERAMGLRPTILPWLVFGAGLTGAAAALLLQWWTNAVDYPFQISGKPLFSLPANIPVIFELTVLFAALTAFFGALLLNGLPRFAPIAATARSFARVTADGFFITVEAADPLFDAERTAAFLRELGAVEVELCHFPEGEARIPRAVYWALAVLAVAALLPPLFIAGARNHTLEAPQEQPRIHIIKDMDFQPKLKTQRVSMLFPDRLGMRPPVPGTLPYDPNPAPAAERERLETGRDGEQFLTDFPLSVDAALMQRGRERYNIFCATCHGMTGEGGLYDGMTARRARARGETLWVPPAALTGQSVREQPVGKIFDTITNGVVREGRHTMPPYAVQIPPRDRWAIVLYVLALQRARAPFPDDFGGPSAAAVSSSASPVSPISSSAALPSADTLLSALLPELKPGSLSNSKPGLPAEDRAAKVATNRSSAARIQESQPQTGQPNVR